MLQLSDIRQRLARPRPKPIDPAAGMRQAAVALILREVEDRVEILFIRRAEKSGDPWSGQMAFPGGHRDPCDADLKAAAMRETQEEIGLDLSSAHYLGALEGRQGGIAGRPIGLWIAPHVFELASAPVLRLNHEVDEVVWAPLGQLAGSELHDTETRAVAGVAPLAFNGYRLAGGQFVWGLTCRMVQVLLQTLDPRWQPPFPAFSVPS